MSAIMTGGCHCGAIRFEVSAEPVGTAHCFCTDCQKLTGTQMTTNVLVPKSAFKVTKGEPAMYSATGDSGKPVNRFFCRDCGSPLWGEPEVIAGVAVVRAGALDDPNAVEIGMSIYTASAPKWAAKPDTPANFPKGPPRG